MKEMSYTQTVYKRDGKRFVYEVKVPWLVWLGLLVEEISRPVSVGLCVGSGVGMLFTGHSLAQELMFGMGVMFGIIGIWYPFHRRIFRAWI